MQAVKKKIALLSNVTVSMVLQKLKKEYEFYVPDGFDTWEQEILNSESIVYTDNVDAVFVLIDGFSSEHWIFPKQAFEILDSWERTLEVLSDKIGETPVFISSISFFESRIKSVKERIFRIELENNWYQKICKLTEENKNFYVFDVNRLVCETGRNEFYSEKMWYMGSMPYSKTGLNVLCSEMKSLMKSMFCQRKKILILDLDQTLWGGVIGEDGREGIRLASHNEGEQYYNLQRTLLEMKKRGVLLAVVSKNNPEDVEVVWDHPHMLLKKTDFVSIKINWESKSSNIKNLEEELNLTEASFVFFDDNPAEREEVRSNCPDVLVLDFPEDTSFLSSYMESVYKDFFRPLVITSEDKNKTEFYKIEEKRKKDREDSRDLNDYLTKLNMKTRIHLMEEDELERVVQLCGKTNQFNLTTKRYTSVQILDFKGDIFTVSLEDKYGQQGLTGVLMLKQENKNLKIDTFILSCRVMGRRLEEVLMGKIEELYRGKAEKLIGEYIATPKNKPVENLYDRLGFNEISANEEGKLYEKILADKDRKCPVPDCYSEIIFNYKEFENED